MNVIVVTGRLGRDPEAWRGADGKLWCAVSLAEGGDEPNWFAVRAFGTAAETLKERGRRGRRIAVHGRMVQDRDPEDEGTRTTWRLLASGVELLDP